VLDVVSENRLRLRGQSANTLSQGRATIMLKIITSTERENPPQNINPRVEPNPSAIFRFPSAAEPCAALFPGGYLARPPLH
jgi:hypothetical protein